MQLYQLCGERRGREGRKSETREIKEKDTQVGIYRKLNSKMKSAINKIASPYNNRNPAPRTKTLRNFLSRNSYNVIPGEAAHDRDPAHP